MRCTITNHATGETLTLSRDVATTHPDWVHGQMCTDSEAELQWALDQYGEDAVGSGPDADGVAIEATVIEESYDADHARALVLLTNRLGTSDPAQDSKAYADALNNTWVDGLTVPEWVDVAAARCSRTDLLRRFLATSGLTPTELSRVLGRDDRTMRRWLAGEQEVPDTLAQQVARLRVTAVDPEGVHLTYTR
jgi:hypothetical protein